jgi:tRNA-2-methylthio-N6-dimethylallyladenosine synthase
MPQHQPALQGHRPDRAMKKLFIQTYGCQMNRYDSERIAQVMGRLDYTTTDQVDSADLILLNTCSVRDKAEQKVYSALGSLKHVKEQRKDVIIGVGGCVAQQEGENLLKRVPHLDLVFGTHNIHKLPEMVEEVQALSNRPIETSFYRDSSYMEDPYGRTQVHGAQAFVTIMQGCNKVCSFCIVPHVRGREISRSSRNILREIESLTRQGVKEVMLLGQNVNSYGKFSKGELSFPELLERVNEIEGLARIRFTTSHPQDLSPELIEAYAGLDKLCEHLHLPVQSGADSVLNRMRRGYAKASYLDRITRLRESCPEVALSTDIIVGFPGETEAEFEQTLVLINQVQYDELFSFTYSPRPQTVSAKIYKDDVPEETKKERLKRLQSLQQKISLKKNREKLGRIEEILVEGPAKLRHGQMMGRTRSNRIVNFAGSENLVGTLAFVRITGATANSLLGELGATGAAAEFQSERVLA